MVDLETRYKELAPLVKQHDKTIIASCHQNLMPDDGDLQNLIEELHTYGDIIKIAVQPKSKRRFAQAFKNHGFLSISGDNECYWNCLPVCKTIAVPVWFIVYILLYS